MKIQGALFGFVFLLAAVANPVEAQIRLKTRTSVSVSEPTAVFGEPVTLSATVKLVTGGTPVGMVTFKDVTAGALLGSAPVNAKGVATLVVTTLKPGIHDIRGTFNGSSAQASSSGRSRLVVRREYTDPHRSSSPAIEPIVAKLSAPMMAVAHLVVVEKLNPRIDDVIQNVPPAARLGDRWNPSSAAWQQARRSISARIERIVELYRESGRLGETLEARLKALDPPSQAAFAAALNGPAGPTLVHALARMEFTLAMMSENPDAPSPGDSAWLPKLRELNDVFDRRIGSAVPTRDARYAAEVDTFFAGMSSDVSLVWSSTVSRAVGDIEGAVNLVMFDDSEAIRREIEAAIATVK